VHITNKHIEVGLYQSLVMIRRVMLIGMNY